MHTCVPTILIQTRGISILEKNNNTKDNLLILNQKFYVEKTTAMVNHACPQHNEVSQDYYYLEKLADFICAVLLLLISLMW